MKVHQLLTWISDGCPEQEDGHGLLAAAEAELLALDPDEVDPRVDWLAELQECPLDLHVLQQLLNEWPELCDRAEALKLEAEFRRLGLELSADQWQTNLFDSLLNLYADYQEGLEVEAVVTAADELFEMIEESRRSYLELPIGEDEVTAETVLGHQLLSESFDLWQTSFELVAQATEQPELWDEALEAGQQASRRLVTVQLLDQRVQASICRH